VSLLLSDTFKLAEELSDSYSSEAATSDVQDKNNLCKPSECRVRRKNKKYLSEDESGNDEAEKGLHSKKCASYCYYFCDLGTLIAHKLPCLLHSRQDFHQDCKSETFQQLYLLHDSPTSARQ
jgi:hypothetical protein